MGIENTILLMAVQLVDGLNKDLDKNVSNEIATKLLLD
jgi:hypothetical protein